MKRAFIFDFDGTLTETIPMTMLAMRTAFEKTGVPLPSEDEIYSHFGATEYGILRILRPANADEIFAAYVAEYKRLLPLMVPDIFSGMREVLEHIAKRGNAIAMVTGKHKATADFSLDFFRLGKYFAGVKYGAPRRSEKTERIRELLGEELKKVPPENIYYIGDMPRDAIEARAAGIVPLSAAWSITAKPQELEKAKPYRIFSAVSEFADFIKSDD